MENSIRLNLLLEMGLSLTEAAVYLALLTESPMTGYKIAEITGKSRSNTYQALKTLEQKSCICLAEGNNSSQYMAIPIETYLAQQELAFKARKKTISAAFKDLKSEKQESVIVNLKTTEQFITKVREMINGAENILMVDTLNHPLNIFKEDLITAAKSGISVLIESLETETIPGCLVIGKKVNSTESGIWPVDWFVLSVDSKEFLVAFLTRSGELINAVWVNNIFVSGWFSSGMGYDFLVHHIMELFASDRSKEEIFKAINHFAESYFIESRGYKQLLAFMDQYREK